MRRFTVFVVVVVIGFIAGILWFQNGKAAENINDKSEKIFVIKSGSGVREVASDLKREGLIKDPIIFFLYIKLNGRDRQIQAGDYKLSPSMDLSTLSSSLTHGTLDIWVTIPEGKRAEEVAEILKEKLPSYSKSWEKNLKDNEGYLFPDTYLIPKDASIDNIISIMRENFNKKYSAIPNSSTTTLTKNEVVTIASLIEREARFSEDRPLVASVILNRLSSDMSLDIDATVQYVLGYQLDERTWWKKNLTNEDKKIDSPYNTYLNTGLPPGPISNPGYDSLNAAINPVKTNYLFYVSDSSGKNHYAKTLQEHNLNIEKYLNVYK